MTGRHKPRPPYVKTMTDDAWRNASLADRALHVARSQERENVQEIPRGSNWGAKVQMYLKLAGILGPAPWCAAFVTWCLVEAGADKRKLPRLSASTYFWHEWAVKNNRRSIAPKRGFLGLYNGKSGGHIWFVLNDDNPHATIEGNTNTDGSREGYGVFERKRTRVSMTAFPRWSFVVIDDRLF
jgi:hypothetical protein